MSTITLPDPHPGRCLNIRFHWQTGTVRCLDYEGHDSACMFPQPPPHRESTDGTQGYTIKPPVPWVSPLDANGMSVKETD